MMMTPSSSAFTTTYRPAPTRQSPPVWPSVAISPVSFPIAGGRDPGPHGLQPCDLPLEVGVQVGLERDTGRHTEALPDLDRHLVALDPEVQLHLVRARVTGQQPGDLVDDLRAALGHVHVDQPLAVDGIDVLPARPVPDRVGDQRDRLLLLLLRVQLLVDLALRGGRPGPPAAAPRG